MPQSIVKTNVPLARFSTFKIGGRAEYYCRPRSHSDLVKALVYAEEHGYPVTIIGGGSNLLIADAGVEGLVVHTTGLNRIETTFNNGETVLLKVGSGVSVDRLTRFAYRRGFTGLEFAGGLPGSLGGAVFMNARCYGGEFQQIVKEVTVVDLDGKTIIVKHNNMDFAYKQSVFMKNRNWLIIDVTLQLGRGNRRSIAEETKSNYNDRKEKGQFRFPSAGCIFKNDYQYGVPTGKIIEELGLKGIKCGGASVSEYHGNFIINSKKATAADVKSLIEQIEVRVREKTGRPVEREVQLIGF
jgi:UDP-N-acetylmuramate dehydrogenase